MTMIQKLLFLNPYPIEGGRKQSSIILGYLFFIEIIHLINTHKVPNLVVYVTTQ